MKKRILCLSLICSVFIFSPVSAQDEYWGNIERGGSTKIGDFEFYDDGASSHRIGDTKFYSDGVTEQTIGNFTFRSDGESSHKIGDHTFRSDSNSGVDIGNFHFYDGGSVNKMDGFKFRTGE